MRKDTPECPFNVLTYRYDCSKSAPMEEKKNLIEYLNKVAEKYENHCSVLVNNLAILEEQFYRLQQSQINRVTDQKINNHSSITNHLMVKLREKSLRKYRSLVINCGTTKENMVVKERVFETAKAQADWDVYQATIIYWTNLATIKERQASTEVDFIKDSPEDQGFFEENLKYLGLEVTPGSHVD